MPVLEPARPQPQRPGQDHRHPAVGQVPRPQEEQGRPLPGSQGLHRGGGHQGVQEAAAANPNPQLQDGQAVGGARPGQGQSEARGAHHGRGLPGLYCCEWSCVG